MSSPRVTERPALADLLVKTKQWLVLPTGDFHANYESKDWAYYWPVSAQELGEVHPLLPRLICELATEKHWIKDEPATPKHAVQDNLSILTGATLPFYDYIEGTFVLSKLTEIRQDPHYPGWIRLTATRLKFKAWSECGPVIPIVSSKLSNEFLFNKEYVDRDYPGWAERWRIGEQLGITGVELVTYCFKPDFAPSADLSSLSFDLSI